MRSLKISRSRLGSSCDRCLSSAYLFDMKLARLGDAVVNFLVSAALTETSGRPHGVKVEDRVLDRVYSLALKGVSGRVPRGFRGADAVEALYGCLWLCGALNVEREVERISGCLGEGGGLAECVADRLSEIIEKISGK